MNLLLSAIYKSFVTVSHLISRNELYIVPRVDSSWQ